jgi:NADPH-dependent 2,4-dienoyl-CoA reductase/sulfur reductase-like enzyme
MEAALTASARGHEVIIYEKSGSLGGNLILAAGPSFKADMKLYLDWLIRQVQQDTNITIKMQSEATADKIKADNPDAVLIAVGADPLLPAALVKDRKNVVWAGDVHSDQAAVGGTVVVAGAGLTGLEAALHLAQDGKKVTVIDLLSMRTLTADIPRLLITQLEDNGVRFMTEVKLDEIMETGVTIIDKSLKKTEIPADTIVLSFGFVPRAGVADAFRDVAPDVYFIGDCRKPHDLKQAIHDAFNVAVEL